MLALAQRRGEPALKVAGLNAMGLTSMMMGDLAAARTHLEAAHQTHESLADGMLTTRFVQDPAAETSLALALVAWLAGKPRRARELSERAADIAVANHHPLSEVAALHVGAMLHALAGEFATVHAVTERLYGVIRDHEVPEGRSGFAWLHGRALVALGQVDEGLAEMRAAARTAVDLGMNFGLCDFHFHHAEACREAGQEVEAQASIDAGLALARDGGEQVMLSPLLRLLAQTQAAQGATATAAESFARAVSIARQQGAAFHELVALAAAQRAGSVQPTRAGFGNCCRATTTTRVLSLLPHARFFAEIFHRPEARRAALSTEGVEILAVSVSNPCERISTAFNGLLAMCWALFGSRPSPRNAAAALCSAKSLSHPGSSMQCDAPSTVPATMLSASAIGIGVNRP